MDHPFLPTPPHVSHTHAPAPPRGQPPGAHAQKQLGYDHGCVGKRYGGLVMSLMTMALCDTARASLGLPYGYG